MSVTLDACLELYDSPMLDGLPKGTEFFHNIVYPDGIVASLRTCDTYSSVLVDWTDLKSLSMTNSGAFIRLVERKLRMLQMRHWFALAYARGGYC